MGQGPWTFHDIGVPCIKEMRTVHSPIEYIRSSGLYAGLMLLEALVLFRPEALVVPSPSRRVVRENCECVELNEGGLEELMGLIERLQV
jgi:hypothetical protein